MFMGHWDSKKKNKITPMHWDRDDGFLWCYGGLKYVFLYPPSERHLLYLQKPGTTGGSSTGVFTKSLQFSGILGVLKTTITAVETVRDTIVKLFAWIFSEMSCMFGRLSYNFFMFILNKDQELWFPLIEKNLNEYFQRLIQK